MSGGKTPTNCAVCGDRASGYNFNVLSCESCKAFFRRNAPKEREFKCIFEEMCEISQKNRKLCRFCRLNKCLTLGMKKEWILCEEQKKVRKNIKTIDKISKKTHIRHKDIILNKNNISFKTPNDTNNDLTQSIFDTFEDSPPQEYIESNSVILDSSLDSESNQLIESEFAITPVIRPITDYRNTLTEVEGNYLTELLSATNILKTPIGTIESKASTLSDALHVVFNARIHDLQRYISMSKSLMAFKNISRSDRISIFRPGLVEMFFIRNVKGYFNDNNKEYLIVPTDNEKSSTCLIDFELYRSTKPQFYEAKSQFYRSFSAEWDSDQIILDLLTAIVLFTPERRRVIEPQTIRLQQHIYKYLLQRYLLLKYRTESEAKAKYSRLMNTIEYLHVLFVNNHQTISEENTSDKKRCFTIWHNQDL